jgi:hypothetical protein
VPPSCLRGLCPRPCPPAAHAPAVRRAAAACYLPAQLVMRWHAVPAHRTISTVLPCMGFWLLTRSPSVAFRMPRHHPGTWSGPQGVLYFETPGCTNTLHHKAPTGRHCPACTLRPLGVQIHHTTNNLRHRRCPGCRAAPPAAPMTAPAAVTSWATSPPPAWHPIPASPRRRAQQAQQGQRMPRWARRVSRAEPGQGGAGLWAWGLGPVLPWPSAGWPAC